jgi:hypothetical protein
MLIRFQKAYSNTYMHLHINPVPSYYNTPYTHPLLSIYRIARRYDYIDLSMSTGEKSYYNQHCTQKRCDVLPWR